MLTIQIDEKCSEFPVPLNVWAYEAVLEDLGYISIRVRGGAFNESTVVGQLYLYNDARFRLLLNFNYDEVDRYPESPALSLYGSADGTASESTIAGAIVGDARLTGGRVTTPGCAGAHRFAFVR